MLRHTADLRQMYDKTRFTKKSYDKVTTKVMTKLPQNVRQLISCRTTASRTHAVIILISH